MKRLLVCFAYFFRGVRIMPWVSGAGAVVIMLALIVPGDRPNPLLPLGAIFLVGFPILVAAAFYRQLIGNRRAALVPGLRYFATGALFLLALCGAALAVLIGTQIEPRPDPWIVGQLAFALISIYLLISQWMVARPATMIGYALMPIFAFSFVFSEGFGAPDSLFVPWAWLALAGLGWLWLAIVVSHRGGAHRWVTARVAGPAPDSRSPRLWQLPGAPSDPSSFATAAGTLVRGSGDRWRNRLNGALKMVVLIPAMMSAAAVLLAVLGRDAGKHPFGAVFLGTSCVVVCILPKALFGEWPARLRLLWLRVAGDRLALWRRIERSLLQEIVLIAVIQLSVAAGFLALYDVPRYLALLYLAGATLAAVTSGYAGFLARISDWSFVRQAALFFGVVMALLIFGVALVNSTEPRAVLGLLPLLLALAFVFRMLARSRFQRMDWCRVRPKRFPRRPA